MQAQLTDDLDTSVAHRIEHRLFGRHAGAHDDEVGTRERLGPMPSRFNRHSRVLERGRSVNRLAKIGQGHARPSLCEQLRCRDTAAGRADHDDSPIPHVEGFLHTITAASTSSG